MSLTLPANYSAALTTAFKENWLFQFYHGDESAFIGLAFADTTVSSIFYLGAILNQPRIRESIDLESSTAKSSNISLEVANVNFRNDDLSAEIFGTSRYFINHTVKVYSQLNDNATLSNCLQIYEGRLVATTHTDSRVRLEIVSHRPWDELEIPQSRTTTNNILIPVSYGDFTENSASTFASPIIASSLTSEAYRPVPFNKINDGKSLYVDGNTTASKGELAVHEKGADVFVPLENAEAATVNTDNTHHDQVEPFQKRAFIQRADTSEETANSNVTVTNIANAIDSNTSTYATFSSTQSNANNIDSVTYKFKVGSASGKSSNSFRFLGATASEPVNDSETDIDISSASNVTVYDIIKINTEQMRVTAIASNTLTVERGFAGTTAAEHDTDSIIEINDTINIVAIKYSITVTSIDGDLSKVRLIVQTDGNSYSESKTSTLGTTTRYFNLTSSTAEISLNVSFYADDNATTGSLDAVVNIYDVFVQTQRIAAQPATKLYVANDGLKESWSGGDAAITEVHEAHRDLLIRYAGVSTTTPTGWSDLDTARDGWDIRWWTLKTVSLKKVLEQMQYEGGFIFRFRPDFTTHYIHIPNSPTTTTSLDSNGATVTTFTLSQDDLQNVQISHTPLDNLMTTMVINYKKHPAESRYFSTQTSTLAAGTLPRTKWNIGAKENIQDVNLDMLVANVGSTDFTGARNSGFAEYYNQIVGDVKTQVSAAVVNPIFYGMEPGDFLEFTNMMVDPFGESWSGKQFIVTSLNRSMGMLNFTAREV